MIETTSALCEKRVAGLREQRPLLKHILLADGPDAVSADVRSLPKLMAAASDAFTIPPTDPEDMAVLHFTNGTTGMPKGAVHVRNAVLTHYATGKCVLDPHADDVF